VGSCSFSNVLVLPFPHVSGLLFPLPLKNFFFFFLPPFCSSARGCLFVPSFPTLPPLPFPSCKGFPLPLFFIVFPLSLFPFPLKESQPSSCPLHLKIFLVPPRPLLPPFFPGVVLSFFFSSFSMERLSACFLPRTAADEILLSTSEHSLLPPSHFCFFFPPSGSFWRCCRRTRFFPLFFVRGSASPFWLFCCSEVIHFFCVVGYCSFFFSPPFRLGFVFLPSASPSLHFPNG